MTIFIRQEQRGMAVHLHITQARPVVIIPVNQEHRLVTRLDIEHSPQTPLFDAFWFLIERGVETRPIEGIADGYHVRVPVRVRGCQVRYSLCLNECDFVVI